MDLETDEITPVCPDSPEPESCDEGDMCEVEDNSNSRENELETLPSDEAHQTNLANASLGSDSDLYGDDVPLATVGTAMRQSALANKRGTNAQNVLPLDTGFQPLRLDPDRCTPRGKANRLSLRDELLHTPMGIFSYFIPGKKFETITKNTNLYAKRKGAGVGREWRDVTQGEIRAFVGLVIYMGVYKSPRIEEYWDRSGQGPVHSMTKCMKLFRFQQIKRYLYVSDPDDDEQSDWFFEKVEPLWSHVRDTSKQLWVPCYRVSADEIMVMCYGRSSETVRMRNKPIGSGFKLWAICDAGFVCSFFPHSNKLPWKDTAIYKRNLGQNASVVARLTDELPRQVAGIGGKVQYVVFTDNFFATPKLFAMLRSRDIGATGTCRSNSGGFPKELAFRGRSGPTLPWNTLGTKRCANDAVLALVWMDNGPVQMLKTIHNVSPDETVERSRKRPRLTSTNGARVRQVFGDNARKVLPIPRVVDDYNQFMGGVDIADQLRASYTSHMPSVRTWFPLFCWLVDTSATNAYKIMADLSTSWKNRHKEFRQEIAHGLVGMMYDSSAQTRSAEEHEPTARSRRGSHCAEAGGYVYKKSPSLPFMAMNDVHLPECVDHFDRRSCYNCRLKGRKPARCSTKCSSCGLFLCLTKDRNCFKELHEEVIGKKRQESQTV